MGDLVRFPNQEPDWEFLDSFVWTPELLAEYADRSRALVARYGSNAPTAALGRWPRGFCQECRRPAPRRFRLGRRLLCERDAEPRLRVGRFLVKPALPHVRGSVSEGLNAYLDLWRVAWTAEELERRQAEARQRRRKT